MFTTLLLRCTLQTMNGEAPIKREQEPSPQAKLAALNDFTDFIHHLVEGLSKIAAKGAWQYLLSIGTGLLAFACFSKVSILPVKSDPTEFMAMLLLGTVICLAGGVLAFYTYQIQLQTLKRSLEVAGDSAESSNKTSPD